jgi:alkaline phosphatase D
MIDSVARSFRNCARMVACVALAVVAESAPARLVVMHGYADATSALVWIQADAAGTIGVTWHPEGRTDARRMTLDPVAANDFVVVARLTGLAAGGRASYVIEGDGDRREGSVRAQPYWRSAADAPPITIAIGSCFFLGDEDPLFAGRRDYGGGFEIFDAIAAKQPDMMLWLGDNLYFQRPDYLDPASMNARHRRQRAFAPLARLLTATAHVAIWDDHDYGPNNADGAYPLKGEALALFRRYWANPSYGLPETPGVFGLASYGDVDVVLLDGRYHRTSPRLPESPDKSMFGAAQFAWLKSILAWLNGPVKLVANGSQFWNTASRFEGLYEYAGEKDRLADFLVQQRIDGLLFLSGDRHFGELLRVERAGAYPLYEFTSSPLTSSPWEKPDARERENPQLVPGTLAGTRQFGLIRVTGPGNDRRIALETYDQAGVLVWRHELRARDLRFQKPAAAR